MTKRSILQHQRCQRPLFGQTIRRRVRWAGWTMLEMTIPVLSLPLSPTFSVYNSHGSEQTSCGSSGQKFPHLLFPPVLVCWSHSYSRLWTNKLNLLLKGRGGVEGGGRICVCWQSVDRPHNPSCFFFFTSFWNAQLFPLTIMTHGSCLLMNYTWPTYCKVLRKAQHSRTASCCVCSCVCVCACDAYSCVCLFRSKRYVGLRYYGISLPAHPSQDRFLSYLQQQHNHLAASSASYVICQKYGLILTPLCCKELHNAATADPTLAAFDSRRVFEPRFFETN